MDAFFKLMRRLPKEYRWMVKDMIPQADLVDDCKYMLYFTDGVKFAGYEDMYCFPVKSVTEAISVLKDCE